MNYQKMFKMMDNFGIQALDSGVVFKPSRCFGRSPAFHPLQMPEKLNTIPHEIHGKLPAQTRKN